MIERITAVRDRIDDDLADDPKVIETVVDRLLPVLATTMPMLEVIPPEEFDDADPHSANR